MAIASVAIALPSTLTGTKADDAASVASDEALRALWEDFKATADQGLRERLILHYSPLVKYVAGRVGVGLPPNIEQADLVSYGIFGLMDAIEKFDLDRAMNDSSCTQCGECAAACPTGALVFRRLDIAAIAGSTWSTRTR